MTPESEISVAKNPAFKPLPESDSKSQEHLKLREELIFLGRPLLGAHERNCFKKDRELSK